MLSSPVMPTYLCKLGTADGRILEREFEASSRALLLESLREQGFSVFAVRARPFQGLRKGVAGRGRPVSRQFLVFNQELLVLLRAGLPILQVLDALLERSEAGPFRDALRDVREDVRGGSALSDAFEKFPRIFPHLYVAAVRAGERTGDLPMTVGRFVVYQKRVEAIRSRVREAMFYPVLLVLFTLGVLAFLLLYVVPSFTQIYADAQAQLPWMTRLLIGISEGLLSALPLLLLLVALLPLLVRFSLQTDRGRLAFDRLRLRLPYFGTLGIEYALSGFCRTLATVLTSGIPLVPALQMCRGTLNNRVLEARLAVATRRVEEGGRFSAALEETGFVPSLALRMIGVGEVTGALNDMLGEIADYYEAEVGRRLERVTTLIQPVLMVVMGLLVGGVVVAMYIPIFQLAGTVR